MSVAVSAARNPSSLRPRVRPLPCGEVREGARISRERSRSDGCPENPVKRDVVVRAAFITLRANQECSASTSRDPRSRRTGQGSASCPVSVSWLQPPAVRCTAGKLRQPDHAVGRYRRCIETVKGTCGARIARRTEPRTSTCPGSRRPRGFCPRTRQASWSFRVELAIYR